MTVNTIGPYKCIDLIGKGGMGEVWLANDPVCDRLLAIKRIRPDLKHDGLKNRFLREAKITAQLTHPGVISIYSIHQDEHELYYIMPYIDGDTLKQIIRSGHKEKASIPSLLPIFKNICQTVAYAHSKGIIHRDLKPENILVGKFGEVILFDWGLAELISEMAPEWEEIETEFHSELTRPGKLVGTVSFMAPERALGSPATFQTDIYSLGVILYQLLTLKNPFHRTSIKEFRKNYMHEKLVEPEEAAPYRDVPPRLSRILKKCLHPDPLHRYQNMDHLITDLMAHLEGRPEWFESARLKISQKKHWEFQENLLVSKHIAITRSTEAADWVSIMVSKAAFSENTRLQTRVCIGERGSGIGFLLSVPDSEERESPLEGYCLWIGTEESPFSVLFRNTVEVMHLPDLYLNRKTWYEITLEKRGNHIYFSIDGQSRFTYLSYLPLFGTHIGVLSRDADFQMDQMDVFVGSQNLQISCLSVPDAFLASRDYKRALAEYRRIGYSFPGHAEGREALFRAGITLLEQARSSRSAKKTESFYTLALEEFSKLHHTAGAPLEYLGKALVYQALKDPAEEIKCLELGLRRYSKHPLISALSEQILYRMHEAAQTDRRSAYQLILIGLRLLPDLVQRTDTKRLFKHLMMHWEPLPFFESAVESHFAIVLAFWLGAPYILMEIFQEMVNLKLYDIAAIGDLIYCLFELGSPLLALKVMHEMENLAPSFSEEERENLRELVDCFKPLIQCHQDSLEAGIQVYRALPKKALGVRELRTITSLMHSAIAQDKEEYVHQLAQLSTQYPLSKEDQIRLDALDIWAYLKEEDWVRAREIFEKYPFELLNQESTLLHTLYGCWLYAVEGEEIASIHFAGVIDTSFPRSWALLSHELTNHILEIPSWYNTSFMWERRELYRQLTLFYQIAENSEREAFFHQRAQEEYIQMS